MINLKRMIYILFINIIFIMLFSGCVDKSLSQSSLNNINLNEWLGVYEFYEFAPDQNMDYNINIYEENGGCFAKIYIDGFQTSKKIKAKVISNNEGIDLAFEEYLPDSTGEKLNRGDILLGFKKVNSKIYTNWGKIQPLLLGNKASGKVCFEKTSFSEYSDKSISQSSLNNVNLNEWVGDYKFYEFFPPNINMDYNINVYEKNGEYFAKIYIDGFQTSKKIKAKVIRNNGGIDFAFEEYLPDSTGEKLNQGDVLLGFKKVNSEILTNWGKIDPILPENKVSGKIYFTKVKE
jgi:hypothetical protein